MATPNFATIQEMAAALGSVISNVGYDQTQHLLAFDLRASGAMATVEDTIRLFDLGPLNGLSSDSLIQLQPITTLDVSLGLSLTAIGSNIGPLTEDTSVALLNRAKASVRPRVKPISR